MSFAATSGAVPRLQNYIVGSTYTNDFMGDEDTWLTTESKFQLKTVATWNNGAPTQMDTWLVIGTLEGESGSIYVNGTELTGFNQAPVEVPEGLLNHDPAKKMNLRYYYLGEADNSQQGVYHYDGEEGITFMDKKYGEEFMTNIEVVGFSHVHFDALGDEDGRIHASPFSHDASAGGPPDNPIPEPGTLSLLGAGLLGLVPFMRRRSKSKT